MRKLTDISSRQPSHVHEPQTNKATPETLRAEAAVRRENGITISRRVASAENERQEATAQYDYHLQAFAVDENGTDPDRSRVAAAEAKLSGLRRIEEENETAIAELEANARRLEIEQLAPAERARIAEASRESEKLLTVYARALQAAKAAENEFYASLKRLRTTEFRAIKDQARAAYGDLFDRAEDVAIDADYQPTITNLNHGEPVLYGPEAFSIRIRRGERKARRASLARVS